MSDYITRAGDTFATVSRRVYGVETEAARIARANPGVVEPLVPGTFLVIPVQPTVPRDSLPLAPTNDSNEVAIIIAGQRFRFWQSVRITRAIDMIDTVEFTAPFEPDAPGFRESFRPFSFQRVEILVGGQTLFTGTMVGVTPSSDSNSNTIQVSAYALPGVLNDCTPPPPPNDAESLQFDGQTLRTIATSICAPFGIGVQFDASAGPAFEEVACEPGQRALAFLTDLAQKRGLIISNTETGELLFRRGAATGQPVARLRQGFSPTTAVRPSFSPQEYHSHITGISPVAVGTEGSQFTVKNPRLLGVVRPLTFKVNDSEDTDTKVAVDAKIGRMFANMVSYMVEVATWRDPAGNLWQPGDLVTLTAPRAMVYAETQLQIRNVDFSRTADGESATLNLVLPGSFDGQVPERLPWD